MNSGKSLNKKRQTGYVAGTICLISATVFMIFALNIGYHNISGQISSIFAISFGALGVGSLWKPDSIGAVASTILENMSKMGQEEKSDSHDNQIQTKSSGIQVLSRDKSEVNITVQSGEMQKSKAREKLQDYKTRKLRITGEEAENIAISFVKKKKDPEIISISSVIPKDDVWEIKGSYPVKITNGAGSERFTVEVCEDHTILSYTFESGGS